MSLIGLDKSKIKKDLLALYFFRPEKRYYIRELERKLGRPAAYIRRELLALEEDGLFASEYVGKERFFYLNREHYLFGEYESIVKKETGLEGNLKLLLKGLAGVKEAYLSASGPLTATLIVETESPETEKTVREFLAGYGQPATVRQITRTEFARQKDEDPALNFLLGEKRVRIL